MGYVPEPFGRCVRRVARVCFVAEEGVALGVVSEEPVAFGDVGHDLRAGEVEAHFIGVLGLGGVERGDGEGGRIEGGPRVFVFGRLAGLVLDVVGGWLLEGVVLDVEVVDAVADLFAGETAVLVAEHKHVEPRCCGMVHEVVRGVWFVLGRRHEEGGGSAEGDDGVCRAKWESEDGGGVVACTRRDAAVGAESVALNEVPGDTADASTAVLIEATELRFEISDALVATSGKRQQILMPFALLNVPEVHATHIANVKAGDTPQEDGCEKR